MPLALPDAMPLALPDAMPLAYPVAVPRAMPRPGNAHHTTKELLQDQPVTTRPAPREHWTWR